VENGTAHFEEKMSPGEKKGENEWGESIGEGIPGHWGYIL